VTQRIAALTDTVQGALVARTPQSSGHATPGQLPPQFRAILRQHGLTDADIDANAPVIVPFLSAMLATDGAVMLSGVQHVRDEVEMVKASRNKKAFPYWNEIEDKIVELRESAAKAGQYLSPADAYRAAVAVDIGTPESRIDAARTRAREASSAADVTAQNLGPNHGSRQGHATVRTPTALSQEDLAQMTRAERKKLFDEGGLGDLIIR
jgi:hypothetical protein